MKKNSRRNQVWKVLVVICICSLLSGCSAYEYMVDKYAKNKEHCALNEEDITRFTFKDTEYTILNDVLTEEDITEWVGYIRKYVTIDEEGSILQLIEINNSLLDSLSELADDESDAAYIIPYLNVYRSSDEGTYLVVDVNGSYHKAIPSEAVTEQDTVYDFMAEAKNTCEDFKVNPQNATQLLSGDLVYQITSEVVEEEQLGNYLDILAKSVVFDADTKVPLTKKELNHIDVYGTESEQKRELWNYMDIYEIKGVEPTEAVAVQINQLYYRAECK
ncbi:NisI/SpaI family lantibiotic immunity lipoprotein [Anaerosporobacter faecicola]|uniref:NisI/SpaI family lantibiotic immunity lipoprotein n=1 Tax=Anaerosporobacter faecicola TaxID=2718714 RepID=UPI0014388EE9|nr:NisI/SpaI family lantibiotic immunity lipoprotein [Anaerosporobacter faecicola]